MAALSVEQALIISEKLWQLSLAILTAAMTLWGGMWLFNKQARIKANQARRSLSSALIAEISAMWSRYWEVAGRHVLDTPQGSFWRGYVRPGEGLFTVYDQNTDKLGLFEPTEVAKVVELYTHAKGFVSRLKEWDRLMETYESASLSNPIRLTPEELVHWFGLLRADQMELHRRVDTVVNILQTQK